MNTLSDINYAMNGEQPMQAAPIQEYRPEPVFTKKAETDNSYVVFKLYDSNRQGGVYIQTIDYVIDPRTVTDEKPHGNGPEMIRLLSGVNTIWVKEQKDITPDYIKRNSIEIKWPRGSRFMAVPAWDKTRLEFMRITRHNVQAKNRVSGTKTEFFEYDPDAAAKAQYAKEMLEIETVLKAKDQPKEKMEKHAFYLGIKLFDDITGAVKKEETLRTEYILSAKRNPEIFKKSFDSKEVDANWAIRKSIIDGMIDLSRGDGRVYWGKNGAVICTMPKTEEAIPYLTQLYLTNSKEGKEFKQLVDKN